jgi:hypothetical protein
MASRKQWLSLGGSWILLVASAASAASAPVSFSRDILPMLSDNCFHCHGPDEKNRKADLRLDTREGALEPHEGTAAVRPGHPASSELVARILSKDPDEIMPPPKANKKLTPAQKELLQRWIAEGAPWGRHWAFERIERPTVPSPAVQQAHPVDAFVQTRLAEEGLELAPEAAPHTLLRRLSFDLTGLPPAPETARRFLAHPDSETWKTLTLELLQSNAHAERMAMWWLDAARYSDTDGYQSDATRNNWPWRDWVVDAFKRNLPFDQFTLEQFAGDLLPNASSQQTLATCFHRNHMGNGEGGRDPEESRVDYVIDRVNTVGTLWLGLTLGCTQCHSHKFDPISQTDYYSLSAFFNSIDEDGKAGPGAKPLLSVQSPHSSQPIAEAEQLLSQRKGEEMAARSAAQTPFQPWLENQFKRAQKGFQAWHPLQGATESVEGSVLNQNPEGIVTASGPNPRQDDYRIIAPATHPNVTGLRLEVIPPKDGLCGRSESGNFILTDVKLQVRRRGTAQVREVPISEAHADAESDPKKHNGYGKISDVLDDDPRNGWTLSDSTPSQPHTAIFALPEALTLAADEEFIFELRHRSTEGNANIAQFRISTTDQPGSAVRKLGPTPLEELALSGATSSKALPSKLVDSLFEQFLASNPAYQPAQNALLLAKRQLDEFKKSAGPLNVMVLAELKQPRDTHVLIRGNWDRKGPKVTPGALPAIAPWPEGLEKNRAGLARWIVSKENPLAARVAVNHLWQICFGQGLVRTPEDFGLQGERPTHPELLDWLAMELIEHQWNLRHILQLITSSRTYRQSSISSEALLARDPDNRLLARGSRYRLPSWMLRDAALQLSGLLNPTLGGPPVRPYQPEGVWEEITMGRFHYEPSQGAAQYRRTLYAFWRRSAAPTFLFDSAQRRVCEVRTPRTNTPLQALTLLNDETQLEASRVLAQNLVRTEPNAEARIEALYQRILLRPPAPREKSVALRVLEQGFNHYKKNPSQALELLTPGQAPLPNDLPAPEVAAQMLVVSMVLNLDESLTHE